MYGEVHDFITDTLPPPLFAVDEDESEFSVGTRVIRGRDWNPEDESDGDGGGVVRAIRAAGYVVVSWDNGEGGTYRVGAQGRFDLRVSRDEDEEEDVPQHLGVTCDACGLSPIVGTRWKCANCSDFDLCKPSLFVKMTNTGESCFHANEHASEGHSFYRIPSPSSKKQLFAPRSVLRELIAPPSWDSSEPSQLQRDLSLLEQPFDPANPTRAPQVASISVPPPGAADEAFASAALLESPNIEFFIQRPSWLRDDESIAVPSMPRDDDELIPLNPDLTALRAVQIALASARAGASRWTKLWEQTFQ